MAYGRSDPWFWRSAEDFGRLRLEGGSHQSPDEGVCLMEAVAWLACEPHTDHPDCTCPVLGAFGRGLNDCLDVERRQRLKPFIPALVGTASDGHAEARGFMAMDWIVCTYTPAWLRLARLDTEADGLRSLPEITDVATLRGAQEMLDAARQSAAAVRDAARAAAGDAAWAAARDELEPTKLALQDSAILLFRRMVERGLEDRVVRPMPDAANPPFPWGIISNRNQAGWASVGD